MIAVNTVKVNAPAICSMFLFANVSVERIGMVIVELRSALTYPVIDVPAPVVMLNCLNLAPSL